MRRREKRLRCVESLEGRVVPSAAALRPMPVAALVAPAAQGPTLHLGGTILVTDTVHGGIPDIGATHALAGAGRVRSLGQVAAAGSVQTTGFIAVGRSEGSLRLSNAKGSVTLVLQGPRQHGFSSLPTQYHYLIQGGTGAYRKAIGSGTIDLKPGSHPGQLTLIFR